MLQLFGDFLQDKSSDKLFNQKSKNFSKINNSTLKSKSLSKDLWF